MSGIYGAVAHTQWKCEKVSATRSSEDCTSLPYLLAVRVESPDVMNRTQSILLELESLTERKGPEQVAVVTS